MAEKCEARRILKAQKNRSTEDAQKYREANNQVKKEIKVAKEKWIQNHCDQIQSGFEKNCTSKSFKSLSELTSKAAAQTSSVIKSKTAEVLTNKSEIEKRWTEFAKELYNYEIKTNQTILIDLDMNKEVELSGNSPSITRREVEEAINGLRNGKAAGFNNIPAEFLKTGDIVVDLLHKICCKTWENGVWPSQWTKSIIVPLPKKGDLQDCSNYRTISLISHPSKVLLKIILNRLKPQIEELLAEEQADFRKGRSTVEQIFNVRILCEKYRDYGRSIYHNFIDLKRRLTEYGIRHYGSP